MLIEAERRPDERAFEPRRVVVIPHEQVRHAEREPVHRAGDRDPFRLVTGAATVLYGRELAGMQDLTDHAAAASSGPTARKRTTSPTANSVGGVRRGSKSETDVRPMICQPPGD